MSISKAVLLVVLLSGFSSLASSQGRDKDEDRVQVFLGVMNLNNQSGELQDQSGEPVDIDFSNLPTIGLEVETPYNTAESGLEYGINAGGGISWKGDDTKIAGSIGGAGSTVIFVLDNSFTLGEIHIGGYLRSHLGESVDLYVGGGPAVLFGKHKVEDDEIEERDDVRRDGTIILNSNSASDVSLGFYARAGIEFALGNRALWGLGVRYLGGEMDFDDTVGKIDIEGTQLLLTYSAWF